MLLNFLLIFILAINEFEAKPLLNPEPQCSILNDHSCFINNQIEFPDTKQLCELCYVIAPFAKALVKENKTEIINLVANFICNYLKITEPNICSQAIKLFEVFIFFYFF